MASQTWGLIHQEQCKNKRYKELWQGNSKKQSPNQNIPSSKNNTNK
jgi:hypothetical protein